MTDAVPQLIDEPVTLPSEITSIVQEYQWASKADATVRAYQSDTLLFEAWCRQYGFRSLPASPEAIAGFLVHEAEPGKAASTIGRRCAAIRYAHKLAGLLDPTENEAVRAAMRGIRRRVGTTPKQKAASTVDVLAALLMRVPDTLAGKRDQALLALGFAGALPPIRARRARCRRPHRGQGRIARSGTPLEDRPGG